jgi:hypothetical protein
MEQLIAALQTVLAGDLDSMTLIKSSTPQELASAADGNTLLLTRDSVARVLTSYSTGQLASADVQAWASFVRRGYVEGGTGQPIRALDIDWDHAYESAIAESIARLDELGDQVDGTLREVYDQDVANATHIPWAAGLRLPWGS